MKIPTQLNEPPRPMQHWWQALQRIYQQVAQVVNGNIEFGNTSAGAGNINGTWSSVTTPGVVNTDFIVTHNLGRAAAGYLLMTKSAACDVYTSPTANGSPKTQLILRASVISVNLTIFVL